jgi:hypothetical protein
MSLRPSERSQRARIAVHTSWSNTSDRSARTSKARQAFRDRFLDEVDPERKLPEKVRQQRAESALKAHYARMAFKSAQSRRRKAAGE